LQSRLISISELHYSAYFCEFPPVSRNTLDSLFVPIIIESKELAKITQDYSRFQEYINRRTNDNVVSFTNLGGDAILIVPIPKEGKDYKNLAEFTKNAPYEQQLAL
jgi:hypothetical protein